MLSVVRTSAKRRRPQRPEFADTTVWGVASFVSRLSIGCAKVAATSLRRCTRGGVIVINSPLNLLSPVLAHVDRRTPSLGCLLRPEVVGPSSGHSIVVLGSFVLLRVSIPFVPY